MQAIVYACKCKHITWDWGLKFHTTLFLVWLSVKLQLSYTYYGYIYIYGKYAIIFLLLFLLLNKYSKLNSLAFENSTSTFLCNSTASNIMLKYTTLWRLIINEAVIFGPGKRNPPKKKKKGNIKQNLTIWMPKFLFLTCIIARKFQKICKALNPLHH